MNPPLKSSSKKFDYEIEFFLENSTLIAKKAEHPSLERETCNEITFQNDDDDEKLGKW